MLSNIKNNLCILNEVLLTCEKEINKTACYLEKIEKTSSLFKDVIKDFITTEDFVTTSFKYQDLKDQHSLFNQKIEEFFVQKKQLVNELKAYPVELSQEKRVKVSIKINQLWEFTSNLQKDITTQNEKAEELWQYTSRLAETLKITTLNTTSKEETPDTLVYPKENLKEITLSEEELLSLLPVEEEYNPETDILFKDMQLLCEGSDMLDVHEYRRKETGAFVRNSEGNFQLKLMKRANRVSTGLERSRKAMAVFTKHGNFWVPIPRSDPNLDVNKLENIFFREDKNRGADDSVCYPGEVFYKVWEMENHSLNQWPKGTRLAKVGKGESQFGFETTTVAEKNLAKSGEYCYVVAKLRAPAKPGTHEEYYRLADNQGTSFGDRIRVKIKVAEPPLIGEKPQQKKTPKKPIASYYV